MNKKYIFNTNEKYFGDIIKAAKTTKSQGYEFLLFNDTVYFVDTSNNPHVTIISSKELY